MTAVKNTRYSVAVRDYLRHSGHATNAQILQHLRQSYPDLSATTVHRITTRLLERGTIACAPLSKDHAIRFDTNLEPHDHFQCTRCDRIQDVVLPKELFDSIQQTMGGCKLSGRLTVQGACKKCVMHTEEI